MINYEHFKELSNNELNEVIDNLNQIKTQNSQNLIESFEKKDKAKIDEYLKKNNNNVESYLLNSIATSLKEGFSVETIPFLTYLKKINQADKIFKNILLNKETGLKIYNNAELIEFFNQESPKTILSNFSNFEGKITDEKAIEKLIKTNIINFSKPNYSEHYKDAIIYANKYSEEISIYLIKNKYISFDNTQKEYIYFNNLINASQKFIDFMLEITPSINSESLNQHIKRDNYYMRQVMFAKTEKLTFILEHHPFNKLSLKLCFDIFSTESGFEDHFSLVCHHIKTKQPELIEHVLNYKSLHKIKDKNEAFDKLILSLKLTQELSTKNKKHLLKTKI